MAIPPPGLEGLEPIEISTSGGQREWLDLSPPVKHFTLAFITKSEKVAPLDLGLTTGLLIPD